MQRIANPRTPVRFRYSPPMPLIAFIFNLCLVLCQYKALNIALNRGYPPPSLKQIPSKGNVCYVIITKPDALRDGKKNIQTRRSTGTSDERSAKMKQSKIVEGIYAEWDSLLARDPFVETLEQNTI